MESGDWVWVKSVCNYIKSGYYVVRKRLKDPIRYIQGENFLQGVDQILSIFVDYGKTWLAWKNKEQAECKSEIVELPCKVGDIVYYTKYNHTEDSYELVEERITEIMVRKNGIYGRTVYTTGKINEGRYMFTDKAAAERRLSELKGERR